MYSLKYQHMWRCIDNVPIKGILFLFVNSDKALTGNGQETRQERNLDN